MRPWEAEGFDWASERVMEKLADRGIRPYEVEQAFLNGAAYKRNAQGRTGDWLMIGETNSGRLLTIVLLVNEDARLVRPITGWPSSERDSRYYDRLKRNRGRRND